ncbi:MAG: topoisomerase DNA-binding C4 zinc finger domain-containing protein, partial [Candidatus Cloacimonetes bacterium]|nr:topoisomerase DNA-binding C4 zinc finger domain-containing protein [Candidatus Cloacimonadota bacterium]
HPDYKLSDLLEKKDLKGKQHFTKPPAYYTEATLIKELETLGIGRPSTYASITNTILERNYVELKEKKFLPTDLGHAVNKFLVANFDQLFNVDFTREMEEKLDNIESGTQKWHDLLYDYYSAMKVLMDKVNISESKKDIAKKTDIICDKCGAPMVIKISKLGQFIACSEYPKCSNKYNFTKDADGNINKIDNTTKDTDIICDKCGKPMVIKKNKTGGDFLACTGYPKCKNAKNVQKSEKGDLEVVPQKPTGEKCEKCGADMVMKSGRFGEFLACSGYPKCKNIRSNKPQVACPECKKGNLVAKKSKKGVFYGCSNYPDCKYLSNYKPVPTACAECGNPFLFEHKKKGEEPVLVCPSCKKEYQ